MDINYHFLYDNTLKLLVSLALGALIGAEREYKSRNIGFRTIILITLGSTLFTIISVIIAGNADPSRVAANIVTGVGFLGAGAIFRDGVNVRGVTTASIIWISAAIGMACGIAQYEFAILVTFIALVILIGFTGMQKFIDRYNKEVIYSITISNDLAVKASVEKKFREHKLTFDWISHSKEGGELTIDYEVRGAEFNHEQFILYLHSENSVLRFRV
jgi:putative Mg2+ transporter-C (MgtC) family protein